MSIASLPTNTELLGQMLDQAARLAARSRSTLALLQEAEAHPDSFPPATVLPLSMSGGYTLTWAGATPIFQINNEVQSVAALALPILPHMDLDSSDAKYIRQLAASGKKEGDCRGRYPDLFLAGVIRTESEDIEEDVQNGDRLRLGVLVRVMEKLADAAENLRRRLSLLIHPPTVQDRVTVDREKCQVVVDGRPYDVWDNHAILFYYLVAANGKLVSGNDIAEKEGGGEFRVGRFIDQIKKHHPDLGAIIKKEDNKKNGRHRIELPPPQ